MPFLLLCKQAGGFLHQILRKPKILKGPCPCVVEQHRYRAIAVCKIKVLLKFSVTHEIHFFVVVIVIVVVFSFVKNVQGLVFEDICFAANVDSERKNT